MTNIDRQNDFYNRVQSVSTLSVSTSVATSMADFGSEINVGRYNWLYAFCDLTIASSSDFRIKVLGKHTSADADEFSLLQNTSIVGASAAISTAYANNYYELSEDLDQKFIVRVQLDNSIDRVQLQAQVATAVASLGVKYVLGK